MLKLINLFNKIDARIDFVYGAIFGAITFLFGAGLLTLPAIGACALLYAIGGDDDFASGWRDIGCSAANALVLIIATGNWLFLLAGVATFGLLTIGLGLPSTQPPDPGSKVGRVAWKLANSKEWLANLYTHAFLYSAVWAVYLVVSILRGILWPA